MISLKKISVIILAIFTTLTVIAIGLGVYRFNFTDDDMYYACTQEAKICPDGSAVGRVGLKCEFTACPEIEKPIRPYTDLINIDSPKDGQVISGPIEIRGQARGSWYFEASFPVTLQDVQGNILTQMPITAQGEWVTNEFVPFVGQVSYQVTTTTPATLVLENDNPSGLPENAKRIEIPVILQPAIAQP